MSDWPFLDSEDVPIVTVRQIVDRDYPILFVTHEQSGLWQFVTGNPIESEDMMIVSFREVFEIDNSIASLSDLPIGWMAERQSTGHLWHRKPNG